MTQEEDIKKFFAEKFDGREYREEVFPDEEKDIYCEGIVFSLDDVGLKK